MKLSVTVVVHYAFVEVVRYAGCVTEKLLYGNSGVDRSEIVCRQVAEGGVEAQDGDGL